MTSDSCKCPFRNNSFHIKSLNCGPVKEAGEVNQKVTLMAFISRPSCKGRRPGGEGTSVTPSATTGVAVCPARSSQQDSPCSPLHLSEQHKLSSDSKYKQQNLCPCGKLTSPGVQRRF